jgi:acyl-coenzyme A synthetase/AMP-(fatty) acid ligase
MPELVLPAEWSTPRCLAHWTRVRPDAVVWEERGQAYRNADLAQCVSGFARALRASSVGIGQLVGIGCEQRFLHFALILACRVVGATSVSLSAHDVASDDPLLARCDLLCLTAQPPTQPGAGLLLLRPETIERITDAPLDLGALEDERDHPEVERLIMTSGTTGRPKIMASTRAMARGMLLNDMANPDDTGFGWNYVCVYDFTFRGAQREAEAMLRQGGAVFITDMARLWTSIARLPAFRTSLMPGDMAFLARTIPEAWRAPRPGILQIKGGALPASLRAVLETRVASLVEHHYATNETHILTRIDRNGTGHVNADAMIRIVDELGIEQPIGVQGLIEARTTFMVDGYLWDEEATALGFRDGWYRTQDLGRLIAPDRLVLFGRADELLILGGVKLAPQALEARIRDIPGVRDGVLIAVPSGAGGDLLFAVLETDKGEPTEAIRAAIAAILATTTSGEARVIHRALPRTETGKVRRHDLRAALATETGG